MVDTSKVGIQVATVVDYQIIDAKKSAYAVVNLVAAMEQLTMTTSRNVIGGLMLGKTLTSREDINANPRVRRICRRTAQVTDRRTGPRQGKADLV